LNYIGILPYVPPTTTSAYYFSLRIHQQLY